MDEIIHKLEIERALENNLINSDTASSLLEYYNSLSERNLPVIYNLRHLRKIFSIHKKDQDLYFGKKRTDNYRLFFIPKKSGGWRKIEAPKKDLIEIQSWIKSNILEKLTISPFAKGFQKKLSIIDNAKEHVCKEIVINIDLEDFFPSITYHQVFKVFYYAGYKKQVCHLLTKLCTNSKNCLPQGSPASPILSNLICYSLDMRLNGLMKKFGYSYSRYADDMTFSGQKNLRFLVPYIRAIITDCGFKINENKLRYQYSFKQQMVTGLVVNNKITIPKKFIKELDNAIYFINKFGLNDHMIHINCNKAFYKEHLFGLAYFVNMIDKNLGQKYLEKLSLLNWSY